MAEQPELRAAAYAFSEVTDSEAPFMARDLAGDLATSRRIARRWPDFLLALLLPDGTVAARAVSIPFCAAVDGRAALPFTGWDGVVHWAIEDALDERPPTSACALEIAVAAPYRGRGLSSDAITQLRDTASRHGLKELVAPLRPPEKTAEPFTPMEAYAARKRTDGLPEDRWLRAHVRAGAEIVGIAPASMTVVASLTEWREWTDLPFVEDGLVVVPGGLAPVMASQDLQLGVYVEPNVWVRHRLE
ncbi:MAG: Long-chain-fatty-acid--CoA ligase [Mycobacterium sp.]|nr:Long-chain-fatty-acid--CoA ligase [Mycobacterium sp.]